jgi:hypothetical protein
MVPGDDTEVLQRCGGYTYEQGGLRGRVGNERGGKEMDRCPLTPSSYLHNNSPSCYSSANLKLITIIECICADGTAFLPGFIFEGQQYDMEWFKTGCRIMYTFSSH